MSPAAPAAVGTPVLVWDQETDPEPRGMAVLLWRSFRTDQCPGSISVPAWVEANADALRARLLAWLSDLGEHRIDGRRIVDRLAVREGFSFWWMTLLAERSYAKSPRLLDVVKVFAAESILGGMKPAKLVLATGDAALAEVFRSWCSRTRVAFEWRQQQVQRPRLGFARTAFRILPRAVQALAVLVLDVRRRRPFAGTGVPLDGMPAGAITFIDYLFHLKPEAVELGRFASNYWTDLVTATEGFGCPINWIHQFVAHPVVPDAASATRLIERFNGTAPVGQAHAPMDQFLTARTIAATLADYARVATAGLAMGRIRQAFVPAGSDLDLWPLVEHDWKQSLYGEPAMSACLSLNLLERTLHALPPQRLGVYLQENQGWERALIHAWKAAGHGRLVGVPHSCINFWDLRFFSDPRTYSRGDSGNSLPLPDLVAANGPAARDALVHGGFPAERIVEVEALRYLYLPETPRRPPPSADGRKLRLLALCDYLAEQTVAQLRLLERSVMAMQDKPEVTIRPHPHSPVDAREFPGMAATISDAPLASLLDWCDVAFTSNITNAAVDAYGAGLPVVTMLAGDSFNLSPLRDAFGIRFVTNPEELRASLVSLPDEPSAPKPFFFLDKRLPRWLRLLSPEDAQA